MTTTSGSEVWNAAGPIALACQPSGIGHAVELLDDMAIRAHDRRERCFFFFAFFLVGIAGAAALIEPCADALTPRCTISVLLTWLRVRCWVGACVTPRTLAGPAGAAAWAGTALAASPVPTSTAADAAMDRCAFFWVVEFMQ